MNNILEIKGLVKNYGEFTLGPVDIEIPGGSILGLIGENGAGKTTTMNLILNIIKRDSGSIRIFGKDALEAENLVKEDIGVVFDECLFPQTLTSRDIGRILRSAYKNWDQELYDSYLKRFKLGDSKKLLKDYSRGMKVKLCLAAALAHHPRLLILDEATAGLDPVVRDEILEEFLGFISDEEHAIMMSSHIIEDLEKVADYIAYIHKGQIILGGNKDEILESYGRVLLPKEKLAQVDPADLVRVKTGSFGCEALVSNRRAFAEKYPDVMVEGAGLEDIMLYIGKGEVPGTL